MDKKFKWNMFVTSFMPLWISIIIADMWALVAQWDEYDQKSRILKNLINDKKVEIICVVVITIIVVDSIIEINLFIRAKKKNITKPKATIKRSIRANKLSSEFLLAYILPMIAFNFSDLKDMVLFVVYFGVLAYLCIRNNNIYTNIYLEFKGYKMYICDLECQVANTKHKYEECLVISKDNLASRVNHQIEYFDFENYIYISL